MNALIKDVMTTRVRWVRKDTSFAAMASALRQYRVSAFPVLDEAGHVIGVVSETDMLAKEALGIDDADEPAGMIDGILHRKQREKARAVTAEHLMTAPPVTVSPDDTVDHAAYLMYQRGVKRLPVTTDDGRLAGIVSRADVLSIYGRADAEIRAEAEADAAMSSGDPATFSVAVKDGVVTLNGVAESDEAARLLARRLRHIQGVVAVRDRLSRQSADPGNFDALAQFSVD